MADLTGKAKEAYRRIAFGLSAEETLELGDSPGHEFHGNQYSESNGKSVEQSQRDRKKSSWEERPHQFPPGEIKKLSDKGLAELHRSMIGQDHSNTWGQNFKAGVANALSKKIGLIQTEADKRGIGKGFEDFRRSSAARGGRPDQ